MIDRNFQLIKQAQDELEILLPEKLFKFIIDLEEPEVTFSEGERWDFLIDGNNDDGNPITAASRRFEEAWGLQAIVFAENGIGDSLVVLPQEFGEQILIMMHEVAELRVFADSIEHAISGPDDYMYSDEFVYRLDDDGHLVRGGDKAAPEDRDPDDDDDGDYDWDDADEDDGSNRRSHLDQLIDDEHTDKISEIIQGLEDLAAGPDEINKVWALNKLSDLYLKGFGPLTRNMEKALHYNQLAMDLDSHVAIGNRAACYLFGMGVEKDVSKALELATRANELSKKNRFADILASTPGGGMYDRLVEMIEAEIRRVK